MQPSISYDRTEKDFRAWMRQVNDTIIAHTGMEAFDIADIAYRDLYNSKVNPNQAARAAIKRAKE